MTTLFRRAHLPSFDGATAWLNSGPLDAEALRGRVVLVDFWTLTCINWLRTEPWIRGWSQAYRDDVEAIRNLVVTGRNGAQIPLFRLARIEIAEGPAQISRDLGKRRGLSRVEP